MIQITLCSLSKYLNIIIQVIQRKPYLEILRDNLKRNMSLTLLLLHITIKFILSFIHDLQTTSSVPEKNQEIFQK